MSTIKTKYIGRSLFVGLFCTCAVQLQAASPQTRPASAEGQRKPVKTAPVAQPKPAPQQTKPQPRPQPVARPNPQPQPGASPITQPRPAPSRVQNVPGAPPAPSQNGRFPQANTMRNGQAPSQFQQANAFANPTKQAKNAEDPNDVGRFFVKWGVFYVLFMVFALLFNLSDSSWDLDPLLIFGAPLGIALITMILYYMGEGINYLIFGPSQFQQENSLDNPTKQAENAGGINAVARFFVKWITFFLAGLLIMFIWDRQSSGSNETVFKLAIFVLFLQAIAMIPYYIAEGVTYLTFGPSVPAQATRQPRPMPQVPMGPPLGPRPMGR